MRLFDRASEVLGNLAGNVAAFVNDMHVNDLYCRLDELQTGLVRTMPQLSGEFSGDMADDPLVMDIEQFPLDHPMVQQCIVATKKALILAGQTNAQINAHISRGQQAEGPAEYAL